jgi:aspartate aminotransferase
MGAEIKVQTLIRAGYTDIVNLGLGQFTEPPPQYIRDAMHRAVDGDLGYTQGQGKKELLAAICYSYAQRGLPFYTPDNVIASTGAKQVFTVAMQATINPGDEVLIPTPAWLGYEPLVVDRLGVCKFIECNEANDFKVTAEQLREAITPKTKWLILNSPGNPTGSVYTRKDLEGIAEVLRENPNILVYCDEIYRLLSEEEVLNILHVDPDLAGRVISAEGTAKGFGKAAGLRLGTAAGPKWLMEAMRRVQTPQTGAPCVTSQEAAIEALTQEHTMLRQWKKLLKNRRNCVYAEVEKTEGITCLQPNPVGGFYGILGCKELIGRTTPDGKELKTDADVGEYFIDCAHVVTVPGISFHVNPEKVSFLRVSFGGANENLLRQGFAQMRTAIAQLR